MTSKGNSADSGPIGLGIYGNLQGQPPVETLLSLRLLKDANRGAFEDLAKEETKFLTASLALVKNDPLLRLKMGGDVLTASLNLAKQLKVHAEDKLFKDRLESMIDGLNFNELRNIDKAFLPGKNQAAEFINLTGDNAKPLNVMDLARNAKEGTMPAITTIGKLRLKTEGRNAGFGWVGH